MIRKVGESGTARARALGVSTRRRAGGAAARGAFVVGLVVLAGPPDARARLVPCTDDTARVGAALGRIERSTDPCGESAQIAELFRQLARCTASTYRICTSPTADRNVFDRPLGRAGAALPRTITWNPGLRSELEPRCGGDPRRPVHRDPTASLLHELVHAAQDCAGLDPGDHELEAVRIENIYRRAAGLCQRTGYGTEPLPARMVTVCAPGNCPCTTPSDPRLRVATTVDERTAHAAEPDSSPATRVGDGTRAR